MVSHSRDETYGDIKTSGYNVWGCIVKRLNVQGHDIQGHNVRGHNVWGYIILEPCSLGPNDFDKNFENCYS